MPVYKTKTEKTKDNKIWYFKCNYRDIYGNIKQKKSKKFSTKEEATKEEAKFLINVGKEMSGNITFDRIYEEYMANRSNTVRPQSLSRKKILYNHIKQYLGSTVISNLTIKQYELFKHNINSKNLSTEYKNTIHKFVITLINFSDSHYNVYSKVPTVVGGFHDPLEKKKEMLFFTQDEFNTFISAVDDIIWRTFFEILFYCGLRQGELQALNWDDIDFNIGTINVNKTLTTKIKGEKWSIFPPKTKSSYRVLPMVNQLKNDLKLVYNTYSDLEGFNKSWFVFGGIRPIPESTIHARKNNYCKKANVKQIRIHDFRHSCASLLISKNADPVLVAKYLGHSDISMTLNRYSHMYKSKLDEIIKLIEN